MKQTMNLVPMVIERENNSERAMDIYSNLLKNRIIMMTGQVDMVMANIIKAQLLFLEAQDPEADITMYIDSPGGEVATGMGIYDTMQYIKPDVSTVCVGLAASMGSLILMGGAKGKRFALPNSQIMIHQPSGGTQGKASDMAIDYEHIMKVKDMLNNLYVKHTGQDIETIKRDMDRDHWLWPQEAVAYGLIDSVLEKR